MRLARWVDGAGAVWAGTVDEGTGTATPFARGDASAAGVLSGRVESAVAGMLSRRAESAVATGPGKG